MPRISTRAGRSTRISGGPVFWLFFGPFILVGYIAIGAFMAASVIVALIVGAVKHDGKRRTP